MAHQDYRGTYSDAPRQHNVMVFVGNGFDVQVMHDFGQTTDTRYENFYLYLQDHSFDETNLILREMRSLYNERPRKQNWSDVEGAVAALLSKSPQRVDQLIEDLREIQHEFLAFLTQVIPSTLLEAVGNDVVARKRTVSSFARFLGDLDKEEYKRIEFPRRIDNFGVFNFLFVNFNYTFLLDGFVHLDQKQFDPLKNRTVDRNFDFERNPQKHPIESRMKDPFSSYLVADIIHPHGHQGIPRSLLFGIDEPAKANGNQDRRLRLSKPFWGQNKRRYGRLFEDAELFIIFGCSLGESDRWWWRQIADALGREQFRTIGAGTVGEHNEAFTPELILYWWYPKTDKPPSKDDLRKQFFAAAGVEATDGLMKRVHVVPYTSDSEREWLNTFHESSVEAATGRSVGRVGAGWRARLGRRARDLPRLGRRVLWPVLGIAGPAWRRTSRAEDVPTTIDGGRAPARPRRNHRHRQPAPAGERTPPLIPPRFPHSRRASGEPAGQSGSSPIGWGSRGEPSCGQEHA